MNSDPSPSPDPRAAPPTAGIEAAAAGWLARRDAGLDPGAEAEFRQWLAADARHAAAWQELESAWRTFDTPRRSGEADRMIGELARRQHRRQRRRVIGSAAAVALAAAAAVFELRPFSGGTRPATGDEIAESVRVLSPERRQLADGSVVELNTGAQIEVHFSGAQRDVRLVQGEALFLVAKDAARPFVVATGLAQVRAVGTAFTVGLRAQEVAVLVTEGTVAVERLASPASAPLPVPSGHALRVSGPASSTAPLRLEPVTADEIARRLAWRAPRLELSNTPLSAVVAALNHANRLQLVIADPSLAGLRLSGVVRADRPEEFVRLLEVSYGLRAERPATDRAVLHHAQ